MTELGRELIQVFRVISRHRGTSAAIVLTLAVGVGACAGIFSVVQGVLLEPLPYPDSDRLVQIWQVNDSNTGKHTRTSDPTFREWKEQSRSFQSMAQFSSYLASVVGGVEPVRVNVAIMSQDFFEVLGVRTAYGRGFASEELQPGGTPAVIVSHGFWTRFLEASPDLDRRTLRFEGRTHSVVGVMPPGFSFPDDSEIWVPRGLYPDYASRTAHNWMVIARLNDHTPLQSAQQEMSAIGRRQKELNGEEIWLQDVALVSLHEELVGDARTPLLLLQGAVGFLLLISVFNAANLLLARAAGRLREMAVRTAMGAGWFQILRQFMLECQALALAGAALGFALAAVSSQLLLRMEPGNLPLIGNVQPGWQVAVFCFVIASVIGILLAAGTYLRIRSTNLTPHLKEGSRGLSGGLGGTRLRQVLVVGQVSLSLVLLVGAGLLGRSFMKVLEVDPGFRTQDLVVLELSDEFPTDESQKIRLGNFLEELMGRIEQIPGVERVGGVSSLPLTATLSNGQFLVARSAQDWEFGPEGPQAEDFGRLAAVSEKGYAEYRLASAGYFEAMGIPLLRGRGFASSDGPNSQHVCLVSRSLAEDQWPGADPIGHLIQFGNMDGDLRLAQVVGVVADVRDFGLEAPPRPTIYMNFRQRPQRAANFNLVLYGRLDPASVVAQAQPIVREMNPEVPTQFQTMGEVFATSLARRRFLLVAAGLFGGTGLLLAGIGIFGVIAYSVGQRTREIGVRMALGALPSAVSRTVLREGVGLALIGVFLGGAAALLLSGFLRSFLYEVEMADPPVFLVVVPILLATAAFASSFPALRAGRVDPIRALREE